jgi:hypothetical protein
MFGALACAIALGACSTFGSGTATQDIEKGLIAAHASYDTASVALQTAVATGILHGTDAQQAQAAYDQVGADLTEADAAWAVGNAAGAAALTATAGADTAKAKAAICNSVKKNTSPLCN